MKKEALEQLYQIFREEAKEHLAALEKGFLDLEATKPAEEQAALVNELFRRAHSLKGAARAAGLPALQQAGHVLEQTLETMRQSPQRVGRELVDAALAQLDAVRKLFEEWQRTPRPEEAAPSVPAAAPPVPVGGEEGFTVRVPAERLDRMLSTAGEIRVSHRSAGDLAARLDGVRKRLSESAAVSRKLKGASGQGEAFERETEKLRRDLDRSLSILDAVHVELARKRAKDDLLLGSLEGDIRQARLLPLNMLTDSLRRAVRDLAQSLGKAIRYEAEVGDILLDKAVIEALKDPLLHLIRNAADHGIESRDDRRRAGKPEEGTISIRASRRGDRVRITLSDDGGGIRFDRVRERLGRIERMSEADIAALTESDLAAFLFKPGFTTLAEAASLSGRGVGLDVVRETLSRLQGSVSLESSSGAGTTFAMTVPVTISVIRILTAQSGGQYVGIPTTAILGTGRVKEDALKELEGRPVLSLKGEPVRWVNLEDVLGFAPTPRTETRAWNYVLIKVDGRQVAVASDDLLDETEVILKPLGFPLDNHEGVAGATIRPDGSVQVVLDLAVLARQSGVFEKSGPRAGATRKPAARVLAVDDSPTTRSFLRSVLAAAGYSVLTAGNGLEALEKLRVEAVDLVVSDVEMPGMDGLELTRRIKQTFALPVILVTALESDKDRRKGLEAGADAYVVKSSFEGEGLLEIVRQFV